MQRTSSATTKTGSLPDASHLRIGIVVSDYNADITHSMLDGAEKTLAACGVKRGDIRTLHVPGGFEVPFGCHALLTERGGKKYDALITLACIVKGETPHDVYIATAATNGIMDLSLRHGIPIAFGVLTTNNLAQARARSRGTNNKGVEAALTAIRMARIK